MQYLTDEWAKAFADALNADDALRKEVEGRTALLAWDVTETPFGDVQYWLSIDQGSMVVKLGPSPRDPDLQLHCSYPVLVDVVTGEITGRQAFQRRDLTSDQKMITVLKYIGLFHEFSRVGEDLDVDY